MLQRMSDHGNASSSKKDDDSPGFSTTPPTINLPKGGGAIRDIGEKFSANPTTGTGSMTIPVPTSPGRSNFGPHLSLDYNSTSGHGPFSIAWHLYTPPSPPP